MKKRIALSSLGGFVIAFCWLWYGLSHATKEDAPVQHDPTYYGFHIMCPITLLPNGMDFRVLLLGNAVLYAVFGWFIEIAIVVNKNSASMKLT